MQSNKDLDFHSGNLIASTVSAKSEHSIELTCRTYFHWIFDLMSQSTESIFNARYHAQSISLLTKYEKHFTKLVVVYFWSAVPLAISIELNISGIKCCPSSLKGIYFFKFIFTQI